MYWPTAIITDDNSLNPRSIYKRQGTFTIAASKAIIEDWKSNNYIHVLCAYVTDDVDNVVYMENNIDVLGNVRYEKKNGKRLCKKEKSKMLEPLS